MEVPQWWVETRTRELRLVLVNLIVYTCVYTIYVCILCSIYKYMFYISENVKEKGQEQQHG